MKFTSTIATLVVSFLASGALALPQPDAATDASYCPKPPASPPAPVLLTKIFTARLNVAQVFVPIPIPGGVRVVEPYSGGTITGSALNGTIIGGVATPLVYNGGALSLNEISIWGQTSDGVSFYAQLDGVRNNLGTYSRLQLQIGGKYASLAQEFLFSSATISADEKTVIADVFLPTLK